jgi:hypothetical protein
MTMQRVVRGTRSGFALPAAIMALVLLSALVAGALYVSTEELRAGRGDVASQRALVAAESALEAAIASWDPRLNATLLPGARATLVRRTISNGDHVEVTAVRVQRMAVWMTAVARSTADGRPIPARHTIAASLRLMAPRFPLSAALEAGGMVTVRDGIVDGTDGSAGGSTSLACAGDVPADVAGIIVPDTLLACDATCTGSVPAGVTGTPPVSRSATLTSDSSAAPGDSLTTMLGRRASAVFGGGAYAPRPSTTGELCDTADPLNWGDPAGAGVCADFYRVVHVRGDAVLSAGSAGQGILLVDGSLSVEAGARFAGVVIAQNDIEVRGAGATITGVAFARDRDRVGGSQIADGGAVRFASCVVRRAALGAAHLARTPGRWWAELR